MNPVLMFCYNNLHLTQNAVLSVLEQDIPVELYLINNGSTDGTLEWLDHMAMQYPNIHVFHFPENRSPVRVVNEMLPLILPPNGYCLGVPNDVVLPSNCYSQMLRWPRGYVSASDNGRNGVIVREATAISECTPMAVMLTRRWAYDAIVARYGHYHDENFVHYASDCDLALRMAACGIHGVQLDIPFWHYGSATWRLTNNEERAQMLAQADIDRAYFERKWGFRVDEARYTQSAADINFLGNPSTECAPETEGDMAPVED